MLAQAYDVSMSTLHIDFVSDIACPWCAIGLHSLEAALRELAADGIQARIAFQPFELNPRMGAEGEDVVEHLQAKYGITPAQIAQNRELIRERGAALGFVFGPRERIWNTFDAHRLLHAAGRQDAAVQRRLKLALLQAYHGDGLHPGSAELLRRAGLDAGLDAAEVEAVIADPQRHADAVREAEAQWQAAGIHAVPAVVINRRHLISGGQPPELFAQALRQVAAGAV